MSRSYGGEFSPPASRKEKHRVANVQSAIRALVLHHNVEVLPTQSSHYRAPEQQAQSLTFQDQLPLKFTQPHESFGYLEHPDMPETAA
jgi:hypothetical protein